MQNDVIIVGGGVIGWSIALSLAEEGIQALVLESNDRPASEASGVAAGILGPCAEGILPGPFLTLALMSKELHEKRAAQFQIELGVDVGFRKCGTLRIAFNLAESEKLKAQSLVYEKEKITVNFLSKGVLQKEEPQLSSAIVSALEFPDEGHVNAQSFVNATATLAKQKGAKSLTNTTVDKLIYKGEKMQGVRANGRTLCSATVVIAAGSWSSQIVGWPLPQQPIEPIRGQLVHAHLKEPLLKRVIFDENSYLVPRPDGTLICGATTEKVGFVKENTSEGISSVIKKATQLCPSLANIHFTDFASNFRPASKSFMPMVGKTKTAGLLVATGHYRNGILLAPVTAEIIKSIILNHTQMPESEKWSPEKF